MWEKYILLHVPNVFSFALNEYNPWKFYPLNVKTF